jgi:hypothetical protein
MPPEVEIIIDNHKQLRPIAYFDKETNQPVPMLAEDEVLIRSKLGTLYIFHLEEN